MADIGIPASLLQRYFSAYGTQSPLEAAITPEKVQGALAAIGQFQDTKNATANQRLLQSNRPEGSGNIPIQSFEQLMELKKIEAEKEKKGQEHFNKQAEKVFKWQQEREKKVVDDINSKREWDFKIRQQNERETHNRNMEKKSAKPNPWGSPTLPGTGTVTGGGVAPSDTKIVGGKTFRRVNGMWVQ